MKKEVGLALGGGSVLGAAHIGALRALDEFGYSFTHISGTSIGSLVGALAAFGKSWKDIEEIALDLSWYKAARLSFSKMGLLSNEKLGESIARIIGEVTFDQANIPLYIVASNITNGEKVVLSKGDVTQAIMASTCVPGIFEPVEIGGQLLVDGGVSENVPVSVLTELGITPVIAVDLMTKHTHKRPKNIFEVIINSFSFTLASSLLSLQGRENVIIISPQLANFNSIDVKQIPKLITQGYEASAK
ncbi:MAG: patatin-like phospholipase family protein [Spirochaetales bacterium]|jgi:NTE family protein|nr:patatin-like phospholipase family protein [Spirochaetales bacterium]